MKLHENFNRCTCGSAYLLKEVFILAKYNTNNSGEVSELIELPDQQETRYTCEKCKKIIYKVRE